MSVISEQPISGKDQDLLNFSSIADNILKVIINKNSLYKTDSVGKRSVNIGIYGEWGSGKTSIIRLIKEKADKKYKFVDFNIWAYKDSDEIVESLLEKVSSYSLITKLKKFIFLILKYVFLMIGAVWLSQIICQICFSFSFLVSLIPYINWLLPIIIFSSLFLLPKCFKNVRFPEYLGTIQDLFKLSFDDKKKKLKKILKNQTFIVIVDDIDRSPKFDDVPNLFIKLSNLFDLEDFNFMFLLDRNKVEKSLKKAGNNLWNIEFINKFIDFHFYIPEMTNDLKRYFIKKLTSQYFTNAQVFTEKLLINNAEYFPNNPRQIKMILRDLLEKESELTRFYSWEISTNDFLLSTIFRHIAGDLFQAIKNSDDITDSFNIAFYRNDENKKKQQIDALKSLLSRYYNYKNANYYVIKNLMHKMFDDGKTDKSFVDYSDNSKSIVITMKEFEKAEKRENIESIIHNKNKAFALRDIINIYNMYESNFYNQTIKAEVLKFKKNMVMALQIGQNIMKNNDDWKSYSLDLLDIFLHRGHVITIKDTKINKEKVNFLNTLLDGCIGGFSYNELMKYYKELMFDDEYDTKVDKQLNKRIKVEYKKRIIQKYKTFNNNYPNTSIELKATFDLILDGNEEFLNILSGEQYLEEKTKNCELLFYCIQKYYENYFYNDKKYTKVKLKKIIKFIWCSVVSDKLSTRTLIHFMSNIEPFKKIFEMKDKDFPLTKHMQKIRTDFNKNAKEKI